MLFFKANYLIFYQDSHYVHQLKVVEERPEQFVSLQWLADWSEGSWVAFFQKKHQRYANVL